MVNLKKMHEETAFSTISRDREINKKKERSAIGDFYFTNVEYLTELFVWKFLVIKNSRRRKLVTYIQTFFTARDVLCFLSMNYC